jgi:hypothetical protein
MVIQRFELSEMVERFERLERIDGRITLSRRKALNVLNDGKLVSTLNLEP